MSSRSSSSQKRAKRAQADRATAPDQVPPSKLLNYIKKDDLMNVLGHQNYFVIVDDLRKQTGQDKIPVSEVKKALAKEPKYAEGLQRVVASEHATAAVAKYNAARERARNLDRTKGALVRKGMAPHNRRYKGCLATRLTPDDYTYCLDNYNDAQFERYKMVPPALKGRVYNDTEDDALKNALSGAVVGRTLSDLPTGFRYWISNHPAQFSSYFTERKQELSLMKTILKNMSPEQKARLHGYIQQNKNVKISDLPAIVGRGESYDDDDRWSMASTTLSELVR